MQYSGIKIMRWFAELWVCARIPSTWCWLLAVPGGVFSSHLLAQRILPSPLPVRRRDQDYMPAAWQPGDDIPLTEPRLDQALWDMV